MIKIFLLVALTVDFHMQNDKKLERNNLNIALIEYFQRFYCQSIDKQVFAKSFIYIQKKRIIN